MLGKNVNKLPIATNTFKKNKRARFNAKEYLKNNVINKEGKAVIPIYLKRKEEMYNRHDPRGITLSQDVREYIDEVAYDIPYDYDITFKIYCEDLTEEDKKQMERVVKLYYGLEISGVDVDLQISKKRSKILYIVGAICVLAMAISIKYFNEVFMELLLLALWYTLWEAIDETIYKQGDLQYERMDAEQLYKASVEFENTFTE